MPRSRLAACFVAFAVAATACGRALVPAEPAAAVEIAAAPAPPQSPAAPAPPAPRASTKGAAAPGGSPACPEPPPLRKGAAPLGPPLASGSSNLMSPHFGSGFGFHPVDGAPPAPRAKGDAPLELTLAGPSAVAAGQPLSLRLAFRNRGATPIVVMRPLDGSLEHWRSPMYDLYVRADATGAVYRWAFTGGRCGNVNAIQDEDYVTLAPGQGQGDVADNGWAPYIQQGVVMQPGRYTAWVVYSFCGFEGSGLPLRENRVRNETYVGVHASNAVAITVQ